MVPMCDREEKHFQWSRFDKVVELAEGIHDSMTEENSRLSETWPGRSKTGTDCRGDLGADDVC